MVFNRKDYGMNKGIPFIKIADRVDVNPTSRGGESAALRCSMNNSLPQQMRIAVSSMQLTQQRFIRTNK